MLFYDCSTAPSPRRARMFIAEKGLNIETREISIAAGEQLSPEFLAVNPRGTVPALATDEGPVLTENLGIAAYLDARFPEPPLMGRTPVEKGLALTWNAIAEQQGLMAIAEALRNGNPRMKDRALPGTTDFEQIPELAARGLRRTEMFFEMLEARLAESPYLGGDSFSIADITAFVAVDFARVIKKRPPENLTATRAWFEGVKARPSASV